MKRYHRIAACVAAVLTVAASPALADYPEKTVKLVVPYPAGGTTDILARYIASELQERLKQPFIVENRGGASGAIGSQHVARSAPDGYTLVMGTISTHGINSALRQDMPYDPVKDFAPVTIVGITPNVISVNPNVPANNLQELLQLARSKPGKLNFGSTSQGGSPHMSGELLKSMANIEMVHVPYKGGGPMLVDLIGGQIDVGFDNLPSSISFIESGKIKPIAVTTRERWAGAPNIPTVAESGLPDYEVSAWFGVLAPAGTPAPVVDKLYRNIKDIVTSEKGTARLRELGAAPGGISPEEFRKHVAAEVEKWKAVATKNNLQLN